MADKLSPQEAYAEAQRRIAEAARNKAKELRLSGLGIEHLPPEIVQLTALTKLVLESNRLSSLPPEIGQLTALTELHLLSNQLSCLPSEIGHLRALTVLWLSWNQLTSLPPEIGQLTALVALTGPQEQQLRAIWPEIEFLTPSFWLPRCREQSAHLSGRFRRLAPMEGRGRMGL